MTDPETVADVLAEMKDRGRKVRDDRATLWACIADWADRIERAMAASAVPVESLGRDAITFDSVCATIRAYGEECIRRGRESDPPPASVPDVLAAFDEAVGKVLPMVSELEFNSRRVCEHFAPVIVDALRCYTGPTPAADAGGVIPDAVLNAGGMLANAAFNLAQCPRLDDQERRCLEESRRAWDAAITAALTPEVRHGE